MMDFSSINVLLVGAGRMGQNHYRALEALSIKNIYVLDKSDSQLDNFKKNFPQCDANKLVYKLTDIDSDIDLCIIATTAESRYSIFKSVVTLFSVRYFLLEKPVAQSYAHAREIFDICEKNHIKISVNHQMRYLPQYTTIKDFINSDKLGDLISMVVCASNIGLSMNIIHYFEAFNWLTQDPIVGLISFLQNEKIPNPRGSQFKDYSGMVLGFNSYNQKFIAEFDSRLGNGVIVNYNFAQGKIVINEFSGKVTVFGRKLKFFSEPTTKYALDSWHEEFNIKPVEIVDSTGQMIRALLTNDTYPTAQDSLQAQACVIASIISSERNNVLITPNSLHNNSTLYDWA